MKKSIRTLFLIVSITSMAALSSPAEYHQFTQSVQYAEATSFFASLALQGNEKVLHFGCRSGNISLWLAQQLPEGKVLAVDYDQSMLSFLKEASTAQNLKNIVCLKYDSLPFLLFEDAFDYIISSSYLHWIGNYESTFALMYESLKPGGELFLRIGVSDEVGRTVPFHSHIEAVANCGRWQAHFQELGGQWYFPLDLAIAQEMLSNAGFSVTSISLAQNNALFASTDELTDWILTWIPHAKYLSPELGYSFASQIAERYDAVCAHDEQGNIILERSALEIVAQK